MSRKSEMTAGAQTGRVDAIRALREAAFTALVAFGVFLPLIGFETVTNINDKLVLATRWPLLAAFVVITAAGRFLYSFALTPWIERRAARPAQTAIPLWRVLLRNWGVPFTIAAVIAYPMVIFFTIGTSGGQKWI